jgi:hypothetical protein
MAVNVPSQFYARIQAQNAWYYDNNWIGENSVRL